MTDLLNILRIFGWTSMLAIPVVLMCMHHWDRLGKLGRAIVWLVCLGLITASGSVLALKLQSNIAAPPHFDMQLFWTYGRTVVEQRDPYDMTELAETAKTIESEENTQEELFFLYPPSTLLLFAPLGTTGLRGACIGWQACLVLAMAVNIFALWSLFADRRSAHTLLLTALLLLMLHSTYQTVHFVQTNFLLLLCVLGFWAFRDRRAGGAALGVGILVKP